MISEKTAKLLDLQVGDTITLKREKRRVSGKGRCDLENYMGHYIYMTPKVYEQTFGEKPDYQDVVFSVKDEYLEQAEEIGKEIIEQPGSPQYQLYLQSGCPGGTDTQHIGDCYCSTDCFGRNACICSFV